MANKIDNAMDLLETAMRAALVKADGTDTLKSIERAVLIPGTQVNPPILGMVISRLSRETTTWTAEVLLMLIANKGDGTVDERITELVAELDAAIEAHAAGGSAGASIDRPVWDIWYDTVAPGMPLAQVGAIGSLRIRVQHPLKVV